MSDREEHNELIHQLAERLRNHAEPYKDGAWERFSAAHGKRRRKLWPYSSAAAVLLAAVGWYWSTHVVNETPLPSQFVQKDVHTRSADAEVHQGDVSQGAGTEVAVDGPEGLSVPNPARERRQPTGVVPQRAGSSSVVEVSVNESDALAVAPTDTPIAADPELNRLAVATAPEETVQQPRAEVSPNVIFDGHDDGDRYAQAPPKPDRDRGNWDLGVMVSPSMTSEKVNMGGGIAVAYRISDKFSIGSGISVAQLGVGENPNYQPGHHTPQSSDSPSDDFYFNGKSEAAMNYKRTVSLTSSVVTLDVPLDLRYDVAKGFYTSVGVSYVAVLNEHRTGHYIDKINTNTFGSGNSSTADQRPPTEFVYSSEQMSAKPLQGNGYAGFMNFSIGRKMPLSGKLFLSVEPYFKLPIGRLAKEEMNFTNGGLRIVTGF